MSIGEATIDDARVIADIISRSNKDVAEEFGLNLANNPKHPSFCKEDWVLSDFERGEEYFIYKNGAVGVGCVAFENPKPGVAYLNRLSVLPEYRQNGVGEELVRHIFKYAKLKNIQRVSIGVIANHIKLKNWYLKLGFVEGEIRGFQHLPFDVQYMSFNVS
ncbi:GNAT family N-acetyltransferase [Marinomonas posidonica]|uniref:GCN5-related N-acetyltransferase n=1 Tax=Marinomonas posidonica (strain CECT 7376 / NCIMB 14433 / IVIA-Po-181) TaxID=491952 RepID=F6CUD8_MARPP|nr:GNAT family N-acetyltransferase [Marinomonas posidonica]AEF55257.1 GCN5-related N-acetyltransferase [Marinomonas posidonica IVIA-Po-181]